MKKNNYKEKFSESHLGQASDKWHCLPCRPTVPHRAMLKMCCFPTTQVLELFFQLKVLSKIYNAAKQTDINMAPCSHTRNIYQISLYSVGKNPINHKRIPYFQCVNFYLVFLRCRKHRKAIVPQTNLFKCIDIYYFY